MLILGIETSCDETSASLIKVENKKIQVLSNVVSSQIKIHAKFGGVVPSLAAREHVKNIRGVLDLAIKGTELTDIDLIAVTSGPGLVSSLFVGTTFAKTLAWKINKPIIGINHIKGHIASNWLPAVGKGLKFKDLKNKSFLLRRQIGKLFPAICLTVSGGHTQLVLMASENKFKLVGETVDDAAGEAFDKIARLLGLGYPGGPAIAEEANKFKISRQGKQASLKFKIQLPRPMMYFKNFDFSFAGLKTAVLYLARDLTKSYPLSKIRTEIAHEAQNAIVDVLVFKTMKAAEKYKVKTVMLAGGVSANLLLRSELQKKTGEKHFQYFQPEMAYTTDNAAMIAMAGYFAFKKTGKHNWRSVKVNANLTI